MRRRFCLSLLWCSLLWLCALPLIAQPTVITAAPRVVLRLDEDPILEALPALTTAPERWLERWRAAWAQMVWTFGGAWR